MEASYSDPFDGFLGDLMSLSLKRAYDPAEQSDGVRILVDRLWPRGVTKAKAKIDHWLKEVAPSNELRKWFGHDPDKWVEFQKKYRAELEGNPALEELIERVREADTTLVYAAKDGAHNHTLVLKDIIERDA